MEKYQTFVIETNDRVTPTARTHTIGVVNHLTAQAAQRALKNTDTIHYPTHEKAVEGITGLICQRRSKVMEELDQLNHNLLRLDDLHPVPPDLDAMLEDRYPEMVQSISQLNEQSGKMDFGWLRIYRRREEDKLLFNLVEDESCSQSFSHEMRMTIRRAMKEAGLTPVLDYGFGGDCLTVSYNIGGLS